MTAAATSRGRKPRRCGALRDERTSSGDREPDPLDLRSSGGDLRPDQSVGIEVEQQAD
jgi:hypothetical protein